MNYNVVYKNWQAAVDDILPIHVESSGIDQASIQKIEKAASQRMMNILQSHPQAVPERVYSFGYGPHIDVEPYWRGPETEVLHQIKQRVAEFGMANVIPLSEPFSPQTQHDLSI